VYKSLKDGNFNRDLNLLFGHQEMEGVPFVLAENQAFNMGQRYYPQINYSSNISKNIIIYNQSISERVATAYTEQFNDNQTSDYVNNLLRRAAVHAWGDNYITCPTVLFGAKIVQNWRFRGKVFQYRLTYTQSKSIAKGSIWANVAHADVMPLVFGRPLNETSNGWSVTDAEVSRKFINIFTYFAKYGFVFGL
jgi:hypothetical protein